MPSEDVNIKVDLDTSEAEAKLNALEARARAAGASFDGVGGRSGYGRAVRSGNTIGNSIAIAGVGAAAIAASQGAKTEALESRLRLNASAITETLARARVGVPGAPRLVRNIGGSQDPTTLAKDLGIKITNGEIANARAASRIASGIKRGPSGEEALAGGRAGLNQLIIERAAKRLGLGQTTLGIEGLRAVTDAQTLKNLPVPEAEFRGFAGRLLTSPTVRLPAKVGRFASATTALGSVGTKIKNGALGLLGKAVLPVLATQLAGSIGRGLLKDTERFLDKSVSGFDFAANVIASRVESILQRSAAAVTESVIQFGGGVDSFVAGIFGAKETAHDIAYTTAILSEAISDFISGKDKRGDVRRSNAKLASAWLSAHANILDAATRRADRNALSGAEWLHSKGFPGTEKTIQRELQNLFRGPARLQASRAFEKENSIPLDGDPGD